MSSAAKIFALSKVFHERARLAIMTLLVARKEGVEFNEMLSVLQLTKGNLALHVRKLEEAGYVEVRKEFVGRVSRTTYFATTSGRRDFAAYLALLEEIVQAARKES